jgi:hypothetical protein
MPPPTSPPLRCADRGSIVTGKPIVLSAREYLCEDCWPFFLQPFTEEETQGRYDLGRPHVKKSA